MTFWDDWYKPEAPLWKFFVITGGFLLISVIILSVALAVVVSWDDKTNQEPMILVSAGYTNTTTLKIQFMDEWRDFTNENAHFPITSAKVDHISVILDGVTIDTIQNVTLTPYQYRISPERHELAVIIVYKNNTTREHNYTNSQLEGSVW